MGGVKGDIENGRGGGGGRRWTRGQLESVIQASPGELEMGLKERNVVEVDGTSLFSIRSSSPHPASHEHMTHGHMDQGHAEMDH